MTLLSFVSQRHKRKALTLSSECLSVSPQKACGPESVHFYSARHGRSNLPREGKVGPSREVFPNVAVRETYQGTVCMFTATFLATTSAMPSTSSAAMIGRLVTCRNDG